MIAEGYHRRQVRKWHHTRYLAAVFVNVNRNPDTPPLEPADLLPLPGDAQPVQISTEDLDKELARVAEIDKAWL